MKLFALVLAILPAAARAQSADGGPPSTPTGPADAGPLPFNYAEPLEAPALQGGSEVAAGLDPSAVGELVHPASPTDLKAAVRRLGGPFEGGKTSVAVQLNPYLAALGGGKPYESAVADRAAAYWRLLQDMAVTASVTPGTPFKGEGDLGHFTTLGFGAALELTGNRSPFSAKYQGCIDEGFRSSLKSAPPPPAGQQPSLADLMLHLPPQPAAGAAAADVARYQEAVHAFVKSAAHDTLQRCNQVLEKSSALFVSVGGRWVMPGTSASDLERVRVQREFVAVTWDLFTASGLELALQARALNERPSAEKKLAGVADGGLSLKWSSKFVSLSLHATRSVLADEGRASIGGLLRVQLREDIGVAISVQGQGPQLTDAAQRLSAGVTLTLRDRPVFTKTIPLGGAP
jgi:hypothetical protein